MWLTAGRPCDRFLVRVRHCYSVKFRSVYHPAGKFYPVWAWDEPFLSESTSASKGHFPCTSPASAQWRCERTEDTTMDACTDGRRRSDWLSRGRAASQRQSKHRRLTVDRGERRSSPTYARSRFRRERCCRVELRNGGRFRLSHVEQPVTAQAAAAGDRARRSVLPTGTVVTGHVTKAQRPGRGQGTRRDRDALRRARYAR